MSTEREHCEAVAEKLVAAIHENYDDDYSDERIAAAALERERAAARAEGREQGLEEVLEVLVAMEATEDESRRHIIGAYGDGRYKQACKAAEAIRAMKEKP